MSDKTPKGQRTRARIQAVAWDLFAEKGFERTTMRQIAREAGVSPGAAYHYFSSKDALVMALYSQTQAIISRDVEGVCAPHPTLEASLGAFLLHSLEILGPHRALMTRLASIAIDPVSPLSPFGEETAAIRAAAIGSVKVAIGGRDATIHDDLRPHLPRLFWLSWMGLLVFWLHDKSPEQARTRSLIRKLLPMVAQSLGLLSMPMAAPLRAALIEVITER